MIKKEGGKFVLHFSDGRKETFNTLKEAQKREKQVNYFKNIDAILRKNK